MKASLVSHLWLLSSRRSARQFHRAAQHVAETQARLLHHYLARNRNTLYLRTHVDPYTGTTGNHQLPITTYDDYIPYIERIANGEQKILTTEPVRLFELSSGSTSASKMIPYTQILQAEFGRGLSAWIHDLFTHHPALRAGPAYWSISPLTTGPRQTRGGIPIGFEDDSAYLGPLSALMESALAVPNLVRHIQDVRAFRYVSLLFLLHCEDLRLISVWNPSFLTLLLASLPEWWDSLLNDLAHGTITPPVPLDGGIQLALARRLSPNMARARHLSRHQPNNYATLWPHLALISCWADGASETYVQQLQAKFPGVTIQPKGLLATEAFVSFPLIGKKGGALAVTSHYFEFLTETGDVFLAHQLEKGKSYTVLVTTGGGLYRYQLNDIVEVTDFYHQVPCLKFIGKADHISDHFGEKLSEQFVAGVLEKLFKKYQFTPIFAMLAPEEDDDFHYTLYLELSNHQITQRHNPIAIELDAALRENFHYDYCRRLGQLGAARLVQVRRGAEIFIRACQARGQKLGNIKPSILQKSTNWREWFEHESALLEVSAIQ
jgi:hypothetical protein